MGADQFLAEYEAGASSRAGQPAWLRQLRQRAIDRFAQQGMPTTRQEEWRFTDIAPIEALPGEARAQVSLPPSSAASSHLIAEGFDRLVFIDGRFVNELSRVGELPGGVSLLSLAEAVATGTDQLPGALGSMVAEPDPFASLNTALHGDGLLLSVPDGVALERPVHAIFITTAAASVAYPRVLLRAGRQSVVALIETHAGLGTTTTTPTAPYLSNAVTELDIGQGARVEHHKLQLESSSGMHIATIQARQQRDSLFRSASISLGGALVRNTIGSHVAIGSHCELLGLYLASDKQHVDHHTVIDHAEPHATSSQLYRGIIDGEASAVFNGKIFVREGAQQTNAQQSNRNLLLSEGASINAKPQLEIWADDVRCTHGATVGQLDRDAVFYLRSRGLDKQQAQEVLLYAFAREVVDELRDARLREHIEERVREHIARKRPDTTRDRDPR